MLKITIEESGFLVSIYNRLVRTPVEFFLRSPEDELQITNHLKALGVNYTISESDSITLFETQELQQLQSIYKLNYLQDNPDDRDHQLESMSSTIVEKINSSQEIIDYTNEMSPVKNQGNLGSCVGFAVVAMKEWQEQQEHLQEVLEGKSYKRKAEHYDLSEQWMYYKCKEIDYWPNEEGTSIRFAMKILNSVGVPCEKAWPYNDDYVGSPKRWAKLVSKWALGGEYIRLTTPEEIIDSLSSNGPLPIGIGCFLEIFYTGSDGIVGYPSNPSQCYGGHAICLVGWNPNTRMFKFKNSWGTGWGENGYGYISYEYVRDFCWDAWMIKDINVTREMLKG